MNTVLTILAVAGIGAAAWHLVRAAFRFLRQGAASIWASELARTRARRGDVTALEDARRDGAVARRQRRTAAFEAVAWVTLLVAPTFTPWVRPVYATFAAFWLLPVIRRLRA